MNLFIIDIKSIARAPVLLSTLLSPVIIILFLLLGFPLFSGSIGSGSGISYGQYYSLTAITLTSAIPFVYGLLFSFITLKGYHISGDKTDTASEMSNRTILISRMAHSALLSFIMVLSVIYITDAVSTEGWLRSIYAAFLLSMTASLIFIIATCFALGGKSRKILYSIAVIFLMTIPSGLLLHHPWNYFVFFSPFYWVSWAWVIPSVAESILYGAIASAITTISLLICYRRVKDKF